MSNSHYRNAPKPAPVAAPQAAPQAAPAEPISEAHAALVSANLEASAQRRDAVEKAIFKLYLRRDGERIEAQLRVFDMGIAIASLCREDDLRRTQESGITTRAKGERSVCSFSETRLFSTRQLQLLDRRAEILASCRAEVMDFLSKWEPDGAASLQIALDTCLGEFNEGTREAVKKTRPRSPNAGETPLAEQAEVDAWLAETRALVLEIPSDVDREAMVDAFDRHDLKTQRELLKRLPSEWLYKYAKLVERAPKREPKAVPQ